MRFVRQYFGALASNSFKTAPDGTRLYYTGGPWARPYVVPDPETEQRLFRKQRWVMAIAIAPIFAGLPFLGRTPSALHLLGLFAIALIASWLAQFFLLRAELSSMTRATARLSVKEFYADTATRHSLTKLVCFFLMLLLLLAAAIFVLPLRAEPAVTWLTTGILGLLTLFYVYLIVVKLAERTPRERQPVTDQQ